MGLCLVVACALLGLTASSALAKAGSLEWGECLAKTGGKFTDAGCTVLPAPKKAGTKEWTPLAVGHKFTSKLVKGTGNPTLENTAKEVISCTGQAEKQGEYAEPKVIKHVIGEFSGCEGLKAKCNSEGLKTGLINTKELTGGPGVLKKEAKETANHDGSDLKGEKETKGEFLLAEFSCGPLPVTVRGGVLIAAATAGVQLTNKMLTKIKVEFLAKEGIQIPHEWIPVAKYEGGQTTLEEEHLEGNLAGKGYVESGQSLITEQKANPTTQKTELRQCEANVC